MAAELGSLNVRIGADIAEFEQALNRVRTNLGQVSNQTGSVGNGANQAASGLERMYGAIAAIGATKAIHSLWNQLLDCISAANEFESAMAGVKKTTDLDTTQVAQMGEEIKKMSEKIPIAAAEIAGITEAAGQLGISGSENLLSFTDTMAKLGTATNMSAEEAATMLAQFANITSMPTDEYSNLGSTITALGNASATTESEITNMAQGMAASATNAGISEDAILGMAAAAASVGIQAEAGSTAWSQFIAKMQTAVEEGTKLDEWAEVAGMTADEFTAAWGKDATGAIDAFITGLKKSSDAGKPMISTLTDLGIKEIRQSRLVQSLANSNGLLTRSLETANSAWEENTALNKEAATRFATTDSKAKMLRNKIGNLKIAIGDQLNPAYRNLLKIGDGVVEGFQGLVESSEYVAPIFTTLAAGAMTYTGALAAMIALKTAGNALKKTSAASAAAEIATTQASTIVTNEQTTAIGTQAGVRAENAVMTGVQEGAEISEAGAAVGATAAHKGLNAAMMANPALLIVTGIVTAATAIFTLTSALGEASEEMQALTDSVDETLESSAEAQKQFEDNVTTIRANNDTAKTLAKSIETLAGKTNRNAAEQRELEIAIDKLNEIYPDLGITIDNVNDILGENTEGIMDNFAAQEELEAVIKRINEIEQEKNKITQDLTEAEALYREEGKELTESQKEQLAHFEKMNESVQKYNILGQAFGVTQASANAGFIALDENVQDYINDGEALTKMQEKANEKLKELDILEKENRQTAKDLGDEHLESAYKISQLSEKEQEYVRDLDGKKQSIEKNMGDLQTAYNKAYKSASESVDKIMNKWDKLKKASGVTVTSIKKGYESQVKYAQEYLTNKQKLLDADIEGLADWVQANDDGSQETAAAYAATAKAIEKGNIKLVKGMLETYAKQQEGAKKLTESLADTMTGHADEMKRFEDEYGKVIEELDKYDVAYKNVEHTAKAIPDGLFSQKENIVGASKQLGDAGLSHLDQSAAARKEGRNTGIGYVEGLRSTSILIGIVSAALAVKAKASMKRELDSHSPSRETRKIGVDTGEGYALGIEDEYARVAKAASGLGLSATGSLAMPPIKTGMAIDSRRLQSYTDSIGNHSNTVTINMPITVQGKMTDGEVKRMVNKLNKELGRRVS